MPRSITRREDRKHVLVRFIVVANLPTRCLQIWGASAAYLIFFFGRSWLLCPHFFFRQLVARGCRRA